MLVDAVIMASIYDKIGKEYDTTRKVDPQILSTLASLLDVEDGQRYLDIACGTGNYAIELAASGGKWFAFDHSEKMLAQARSKSTLIDWRQYDVAQLGYEDTRMISSTRRFAPWQSIISRIWISLFGRSPEC